MNDPLPSQNWRWTPLVSIGGALVLAAILFLLIPLTQSFDEPAKPDLMVREMRVSLPPPPDTPPLPEEIPPAKPEPALSQLSEDPPPIDLQPLDIALAPGRGEAMLMGAALPAFQMETDAVADIERLFTFNDLNEAPRLINAPRFRYPAALVRRGIEEGQVIVEIDIFPDGSARLYRVVSSTHRELEPIAREIIGQARFTQPAIDGQPQTVRGRFPLVLRN